MKEFIFLLIIFTLNTDFSSAQDESGNKWLYICPKALNVGEYDFKKEKIKSYTFLDEVASVKVADNILKKDSTHDLRYRLGGFRNADGEFEYELDFIYSPEYKIFIINTPCNVEIYDLKTKKSLHCDPTTYVYSPSGKYRFGYYAYDETRYYLEEKINDEYNIKGRIKNDLLLFYHHKTSGFYWIDDETLCFLNEREHSDGRKYWIAYSTKFYNRPLSKQ